MCDGCPVDVNGTCDGCNIDRDEDKVPAGCVEALEGTVHVAGATLETLEMVPGRYRATNESRRILECYQETACLGGQTGDDDFCADGYTGPCEFIKRSRKFLCEQAGGGCGNMVCRLG